MYTMSSAENESKDVVDSLSEIMKDIASFPECRHPTKKQYGNLVRRLKLLSPLFDELRDRAEDAAPGPAASASSPTIWEAEDRALRSLKVALESSKEFLQSLNEGSKLYQAFEWEKIANKFHDVTEQVVKALSEVPFDKLNVSEEVQEQIELVHSQFRRAKGCIETPDLLLFRDLSQAMNEETDQGILRRLSEKLHLRTINDLKKETLALNEMAIACGGDPGVHLEEMTALLKKLKDCVLSENPDTEMSGNEKSIARHRSPVIPDDFRCPISLELMKDPVIVSTGQDIVQSLGILPSGNLQPLSTKIKFLEGCSMDFKTIQTATKRLPQNTKKILWSTITKLFFPISPVSFPNHCTILQTYERACIQKWLDAGHKTCPKTQQTLSHTALTPNYVLKSLIAQWCESNGVELPKRQGSCRNRKSGSCVSECDRKAINSLLEKLKNGSQDDQRAAAGELRLLAKRNADNRVCIAEAGAIPLLVELLASPDPRTQEHAVTAILNLSINDTNKGSIVNAGAIPDIVDVLKNGSMEARENAAATLFSLSVVDENKVAIGAAGAIPALIDLLCEGSPRGKKDAATAIFNLSIYQGNKARAVRAGIVAPLMRVLVDAGGGMVDEGLAILAILASHPEGKLAIGQAEPIPILVEVMRTGSPRNRENAAAVLWSLCTGDPLHVRTAKELGAEEALKELAENGTDRAKRKASNVLELMHRNVDM